MRLLLLYQRELLLSNNFYPRLSGVYPFLYFPSTQTIIISTMDNSNNEQVFHSSNIANQTLAGSAADPFTLTDKEKKRQEKQAELNNKRKQRAEAKAERRAKLAELRQRLDYWRKSNPLAFILSSVGVSILVLVIIVGSSWFIVSQIAREKAPTRTTTNNNIDPTDYISVNCKCAKGSQEYNELKEDYEMAAEREKGIISNFDYKTATPFQTIEYINAVIGSGYLEDAYDSAGNLNTVKAFDNYNQRIQSANITNDDQKTLLELYSSSIYNKAKQYNQTLEKLFNYIPENMPDGTKYIYYSISYDAYKGLGYTEKADSIAKLLESIPYGSGSF